jgi:2-desacetyl-2-hydroxyethyl bacteriochlorophyllide A dehydrogenase
MARALSFDGPRSVSVRERPVGDPGPDEVLVETRASAISAGTELLVYRGDAPEELPADETLDALEGDLSFPLQYGYAAVGDVVSTGSDVDGDWRGRTVFAFVPHQSRFRTDPDALVELPPDLAPERATLLPTVETATNLALDGRPRLGERVVVFGAGPVGLATVDVLSSFPLADLVAVEPRPARRELARSFGADAAVAPDEVDDHLDWRSPPGADLAYELSGEPATLDDAVEAVGYDGRVVVGSWYGEKRAPLDLGGTFHRGNVSVESSQVSTVAPPLRGRWTNDRRLETALAHLRTLDVDALVTHRVPFDDAPEAYRLLADDERTAVQVLLTYDP